MKRSSRIVAVALGALLAVAVLYAAAARLVPAVNVSAGQPVWTAAPTGAEPGTAGAFSTAVHQVAERVKPASAPASSTTTRDISSRTIT